MGQGKQESKRIGDRSSKRAGGEDWKRTEVGEGTETEKACGRTRADKEEKRARRTEDRKKNSRKQSRGIAWRALTEARQRHGTEDR